MSEKPDDIKTVVPAEVAQFEAATYDGENTDSVKWLAERHGLRVAAEKVRMYRGKPVPVLSLRTKRNKLIEVWRGQTLIIHKASVRSLSASDFEKFYKEI